jgi:DNA-binding phage protein
MTFNQKLQRFAETHKMSVVARKAGTSQQCISQCLRRDTPPRGDIVFKIAVALGVSADWLLDDTADWPPVWRDREAVVNAA